MSAEAQDIHFLQHAVRIGARGLGRTWPNPSVGCVLVKDGTVIAAARSADGGRPHAETEALAQAGTRAKGATAYVSLEPCSHIGKTGPCAEALADAGITRVVLASTDPDARVNGNGIKLLRKKSIDVVQHELAEAEALHRGFFARVATGMPYVVLKVATSADGFMADTRRNNRWITGDAARRHVHALRGRMDAVLTGIGTVLADDPELTCRLQGAQNPYLARIVADRALRLPLDCKLVKSAEAQPTWVITSTTAIERAASHATDLRERGVVIIALEDETLSPRAILTALGQQGITRLLVEAGPELSGAFIGAQLVDTLYWYRAPSLLGEHGAAAFLHADAFFAEAAEPQHHSFGGDSLDIYELKG